MIYLYLRWWYGEFLWKWLINITVTLVDWAVSSSLVVHSDWRLPVRLALTLLPKWASHVRIGISSHRGSIRFSRSRCTSLLLILSCLRFGSTPAFRERICTWIHRGNIQARSMSCKVRSYAWRGWSWGWIGPPTCQKSCLIRLFVSICSRASLFPGSCLN